MKLVNELLYLIKEDGKQFLVIPWNLIESVLSIYHNDALAVHLSRDRLNDHLRNRFYWYGMYAYVVSVQLRTSNVVRLSRRSL